MSGEFWSRPIFCVRDVAASVAYYCEKLGFTRGWEHGGESLIIAQVGREGFDLILDSDSVIPRAGRPSVVSLTLPGPGIGALYRELAGRGAKVGAPPSEVVWQQGTYQFEVEDLDGNILVFWNGAPEAPARTGRTDPLDP
jgi:catechol 2,3-dioxygenase-like lactoylglutathione lyase family enzyme